MGLIFNSFLFQIGGGYSIFFSFSLFFLSVFKFLTKINKQKGCAKKEKRFVKKEEK
jgi:hypothetical protein